MGCIEPETVRRLACDADVMGAVVDADGEVFALGRSRRLMSRAQRRALMIRGGLSIFQAGHENLARKWDMTTFCRSLAHDEGDLGAEEVS